MIADNASNRKKIKNYLDNISEDDLIDEIIIPLFAKNSYYIHRRNIHGPGEHGKDIIFYRYVRMFLDKEFITVQAKAEKATTHNASHFAQQINRAHKVPVVGNANATVYPNYVMFINSKIHTNDVDFELHYLTDVKTNTKIITQDQLVELILEFQIVPSELDSILLKYKSGQSDSYDDHVRNILLSGDAATIGKLLDNDLKIDSRILSDSVKKTIINYIFKSWEDDSSWDNTAVVMDWLNYYFDFIQPEQYKRMLKVFEEYIATYPSRKAKNDTSQVLRKVTPAQIESFGDSFLQLIIQAVHGRMLKASDYPILFEKFDEWILNYPPKTYKKIVDKFNRYRELFRLITKEKNGNEEALAVYRKEYRELGAALYEFLYPDEAD